MFHRDFLQIRKRLFQYLKKIVNKTDMNCIDPLKLSVEEIIELLSDVTITGNVYQ